MEANYIFTNDRCCRFTGPFSTKWVGGAWCLNVRVTALILTSDFLSEIKPPSLGIAVVGSIATTIPGSK